MSDSKSERPEASAFYQVARFNDISILTVFLLLIISLVIAIFEMFYKDGEAAPIPLRYILMPILVLLLISVIFDYFRDWKGRAVKNRAHIREAQVITRFWKVKTFLLLHSDGSFFGYAFILLVLFTRSSKFSFFEIQGIILIVLNIELHFLLFLLNFVAGGFFLTELYLDPEYVKERKLTDKAALIEELKETWWKKVMVRTEHRTLDV